MSINNCPGLNNITSFTETLVPAAFAFARSSADIFLSLHNGELTLTSNNESHPDYNTTTRDLLSFDIYRDGTLIDNVAADIFSYRDEPLENMQEYCYALGSNYDEGTSEISDLICATPYPGPPATDLVATDLGGSIGLEWVAAIVDSLFENEGDILIDYQIY